jgi:predicted nucleic acid-binding protein
MYAQIEGSLYLSAITVGELHKGVNLLPPGKRRTQLEDWFDNDLIPRFSDRILPVTPAIGRLWGSLAAGRQLAGRPLAMADGLIAATALEHHLTVVTRNVKDFAGLGVTLLNPWDV